jgi:hypothetical protein
VPRNMMSWSSCFQFRPNVWPFSRNASSCWSNSLAEATRHNK